MTFKMGRKRLIREIRGTDKINNFTVIFDMKTKIWFDQTLIRDAYGYLCLSGQDGTRGSEAFNL